MQKGFGFVFSLLIIFLSFCWLSMSIPASSSALRQKVSSLLPSLSSALRKGNRGRVGVVGGSLEYTGAPYFAAMSALRCGADLSHVFSLSEAGTAIKAYSGDVIVHPILEASPDWQRLGVTFCGPLCCCCCFFIFFILKRS